MIKSINIKPSVILLLLSTVSFSAPVLIGDGFSGITLGDFGTTGIINEFVLLNLDGNLELSTVTIDDGTEGTLISQYLFTVIDDIDNASLSVFVDADIDPWGNSSWNETAEMLPGTGGATSWEIDEPGYRFGDIYDNLYFNNFDNTVFNNIFSEEDISMGLGFNLGSLSTGDQVIFDVALSENIILTGEWGTILHQWDVDYGTGGDNLFMAGRFSIRQSKPASVPEPSVFYSLLTGIFIIGLVKLRIK